MTTTALLETDSELTREAWPPALPAGDNVVAEPVEAGAEFIESHCPDFRRSLEEAEAYREAIRRRVTAPLATSTQYQPRHWGLNE